MQKNNKVIIVSVLCSVLIFSGSMLTHAASVESGLVSMGTQRIPIWGGIEYFFTHIFRPKNENKRFVKPDGAEQKSKKAVRLHLSELDQQLQASRLIATSA